MKKMIKFLHRILNSIYFFIYYNQLFDIFEKAIQAEYRRKGILNWENVLSRSIVNILSNRSSERRRGFAILKRIINENKK